MHHLRFAAIVALAAACGGSEPAPSGGTQLPPAGTPPSAPAQQAPAEQAPAAGGEAAGEADLASMSEDEQKAYLMELGEKVYLTGGSGGVACSTCHQANGEGLPPSFPPLKGAAEWMKDCTTHAGYVVKGMSGEIVVNGVTYNGVMPAQANLSDLEIAAVITYERNSWGNDYGICLPETVAAAR